MKEFTINGTAYKAKEISFNFMCFLEDKDIALEQIDSKPMKFGREYLAFCGNMTSEEAGEEIDKHVINGGDLGDLYAAMADAMEASGFFRAISGETAPEKSTKKKAKAE